MKRILEKIMFGSKWLLMPFYIGLIIALGVYSYKFIGEIFHMFHTLDTITESQMMLSILTLIDITMIANLIKMIITGSYQTFINTANIEGEKKVSSGALKVKMGMSIIGVSSIHLLQVFINSGQANITDREVIIKSAVHVIFILSTIGLAYIDYLCGQTDPH